MSDEINIKVILDPSTVQAGSADVVAAVQAAASDIVSSLGKVTSSSNSTGAAIRSGFSGVEDELKKVQTQLAGITTAAASAGSAVTGSLNQISPAAQGAAQSMTNVGHATAGVRREFLVLGHEIVTGQWTRFGGSLLVLAERMDLLSKLTGPVGIGLGVIGGTVAALAVAAVLGAEDVAKLERSLELTGNAAGLTQDKYLSMAKAISDANSMITVRSAQGAVQSVAATGAFGPAAVQAVASAVAEISRLSGENADKVANDFAKMSDGVYKWANDSKIAKNLVSAADAEYVRGLENQGKAEEAEIYLAQRISDRLHQVQTDLGILPSYWNAVHDAAVGAWDAMMGIGRPDTLGDQIEKLKARKAALTDGSNELGSFADAPNFHAQDTAASLDSQIAALQKKADAQNEVAKADAKEAEANREGKQASDRLHEDLQSLKAKSVLQEKIADFQRDIAKSSANGGLVPSQKEQEQYIAYLTKLYSAHEPKAKQLGTGGAAAVGKSEDNGELALLKDRLSAEQKIVESSYRDGEISLKQYYDERKRLVEEGMSAEIAVAQKGVANAENATKYAQGPNQQAEAQARVVQAKNRVALLNQQLNEQESQLTAEMQEQGDLQNRKLAQLQQQQNVSRVDFSTSQEEKIAQLKVSLGEMTNKQLIALDMELENQRYQVAIAGLQQRAGLAHQTVEQQQQINSQIEQLEQQHQARVTELQIEAVNQQTQAQKQAMNDFSGDIESLTEQLIEKPQQWKQAFGSFFQTLDQQLVKLATNDVFKQLAGPGTSVGGGLNGLFGKLLGGATGPSTTGSQTIGSATIATATIPTMSVGSMTVGASVGGSGAGGGLGSLLSGVFSGGGSFGGAFGMSSGLEGSATAVTAGLGAGADAAGATDLSAMMGLAAFATGSPYVPETQLALVHRGEAIIPAAQNSPYANSGGMTVTNHFNLPGNTDLRTQSQMAGMAGAALQNAMRRNG